MFLIIVAYLLNQLISSTNQLTGYYMMVTLVFNELKNRNVWFAFDWMVKIYSNKLDHDIKSQILPDLSSWKILKHYFNRYNMGKYSRMDLVKFVDNRLKKMKWYGILSRPYHFQFLNGCLPQISLGPFLNTLSHISIISVG